MTPDPVDCVDLLDLLDRLDPGMSSKKLDVNLGKLRPEHEVPEYSYRTCNPKYAQSVPRPPTDTPIGKFKLQCLLAWEKIQRRFVSRENRRHSALENKMIVEISSCVFRQLLLESLHLLGCAGPGRMRRERQGLCALEWAKFQDGPSLYLCGF